eukprot:471110-Alexandrium_andersonii.AAC.1
MAPSTASGPITIVADNEQAVEWANALKEGFDHVASPCADLLKSIAQKLQELKASEIVPVIRWHPGHVLDFHTDKAKASK